MREIKFRAWQSKDNVMLTWGKLQYIKQFALDDFMNKDSVIVLPVNKEITLMQYTGLKDKNGVEIYEGDIVRVNAGESWNGYYELQKTLKIEYRGCCFDAVDDDGCGYMIGTSFGSEDIEVIGNIYENPELLEAK